MCTPVFLVLLSLAVTRATAAGVVKRSDDTDPLEVVVHQQTSLIQNLQADLQALRSELMAVKSATQVQGMERSLSNVYLERSLKFYF